jgi:hypothetical protein
MFSMSGTLLIACGQWNGGGSAPNALIRRTANRHRTAIWALIFGCRINSHGAPESTCGISYNPGTKQWIQLEREISLPDVVVIIPVFNRRETTLQSLRQLQSVDWRGASVTIAVVDVESDVSGHSDV